MKRTKQVQSAWRILRSRLTGERIPVAVRWNLLNRCSCRCAYCNIWQTPGDELTTNEILDVLGQLAELGTTRISFSGGEPLLRKDIGAIVRESARLGLSPTMNSSGYGLRQRVHELGDLDLLKISLDGPEEVHDEVRGRKGAHRTALAAAELARDHLRRFSFATTMTARNIQHLPYLLETAARFGTVVAFQPLKTLYRGVADHADHAPTPAAFQRAVDYIEAQKRAGNPCIRNSPTEIARMRHWPEYPPLRCGAGHVFVMIGPDGALMPCDRIGYDGPLPNVRTTPVAEALRALPDFDCAGCAFCGALELNYFYSLRPLPVLDALRSVRKLDVS